MRISDWSSDVCSSDLDGLGGPGSPTGYYVNKMLDAEVTNHIFTTSLRCLPLIRYAAVLLNFAEARNEYSGPDQDVYDAIEAIRKRAGLDPYTLPDRKSTRLNSSH